MSHICNKYIIEEGVFKRDFEGMYQNCEDPWGQGKTFDKCITNNMSLWLLMHMRCHGNFQIGFRAGGGARVLDIGCANGYYADRLIEIAGKDCSYTGTDISPTIIRAARSSLDSGLCKNAQFVVDDIRIRNDRFVKKFDLIFSAKTLYYVAPEIDPALWNIHDYLRDNGVLCFVYNTTPGAFSNKWLTYETLRKKILKLGFNEKMFVEINRFSPEIFVIGIYQNEPSLY